MRYHLDTIPVWDAFKQDEYCPFCSLFRKREVIHVDRTLGGAVMEPDTRIRVNEQGFCPEHHRQLYALQNRLGHALIMESHLKVLTEKAEKILASGGSKGGFFRKDDKPGASQQLRQLTSSCIICDSIRNDMAQYAYTAALLFEKDSEFRQAFENAHLCLEHLALLTQAGEEHLSSAARVVDSIPYKERHRAGQSLAEQKEYPVHPVRGGLLHTGADKRQVEPQFSFHCSTPCFPV